MKSLFLFLALATTALGQTADTNVFQLGGNPNSQNPCISIAVGALPTTQPVTISATIASSTSGNFLMLTNWGNKSANGAWQVPNGKTFRSCSIDIFTNNVNAPLAFAYGTNPLASDNTATPPVGGLTYFSAGSGVASLFSAVAVTHVSYPQRLDFPSLSYPVVQTQANTSYNVIVTGILQ